MINKGFSSFSWLAKVSAVLVVSTLTACGGGAILKQLDIGMTTSEVINLVGEPDQKIQQKARSGETEVWIYRGLPGNRATVTLSGGQIQKVIIQ